MLTIVIPARNEAKYLPNCLSAIERAKRHITSELEVIVVLNRCTDRTEEIARAAGCKIVENNSKNLSSIRNTGAFAATGEFLVTIDADSYMSERLLAKIESKLQDDNIIGGGVLMFPERWSLGIILTFLVLIPVALIYRISAGVFFCRKSSFEAIGGFNEKWYSAEDIEFARRLRAHGKQNRKKFITIFSAWIVTSCRKFDEFGDWYAIKRPKLFYELLFGKNKEAANTYWYDVER